MAATDSRGIKMAADCGNAVAKEPPDVFQVARVPCGKGLTSLCSWPL